MMKRYLDHNPETVALIGMGPSITDIFAETLTQEYMPSWADEIWAINMVANVIWHDVSFWMDDLNSQEKFKPGLISALRRRGQPVITSKAYTEIIPNSYDFPLDEVAAISMPVFGKPYMNNSVAQAIGYAMWKGVKVLKIYGADFTYPNRDYAESGRACVESWISLACAKNTMEIRLCPNTTLFDAINDKGVYGYATQPVITLPNGTEWQQDIRAFPQQPGYVPEDSSGQSPSEENDAVQRCLPGDEGASAEDRGTPGDAGNGLDTTPAPAAPRPGEGLRDPGQV